MIKELSREFVGVISKEYPNLEELNLSSNGKPAFTFLTNCPFVQRSKSSKTLKYSAVHLLS